MESFRPRKGDEDEMIVDYKGQQFVLKRDDFFKLTRYLNEHKDEEIYYETLLVEFGVTAMFFVPILEQMEMLRHGKVPVLNEAITKKLEKQAVENYVKKTHGGRDLPYL